MNGLTDAIKEALEANDTLMDILSGGIHVGIEEINRQLAPGAFDANGEIQPSMLVKLGVEIPSGPFKDSAQTPVILYFYDRASYANIEDAMSLVFLQMNEAQVGDYVWELRFSNAVYNQRDVALDCPLSTLRFVAVRQLKEGV